MKLVAKRHVSLALPPYSGDSVNPRKRMEKIRFQVTGLAQEIINRGQYGPVGDGSRLIVVQGSEIDVKDRSTYNVHQMGKNSGFVAPTIAQGFLLPLIFTEQSIRDMGLETLVVMHQPIVTSDNIRRLLGLSFHNGEPWFYGYNGEHDRGWDWHVGFVFAETQPLFP